MIVDSSTIVAILRGEQEGDYFTHFLMMSQETKRISAAGYLETSIVVDSVRDPVLSRRLDEYIAEIGITIEPVTEAQVKLARQAYRDFGRGSGHPAALNFGDCFAYALAKDKGERLLFKGSGFSQTDIAAAG